ncbi:ectonucleoside triphosphate diphosphohydrolase 2 isoform X2 [Lepus europaeus]|uniref:ectonucleoside triphosphate diphosphohydrolase 2 isoform X2 n=1 Tax=Lepus europaeus TaxID=9983 RepID=UPI002B4AA27D|nr:ectonucleoside triphosphate diphosphohydrolase 2 isoform X2 [Lepus europaeus]
MAKKVLPLLLPPLLLAALGLAGLLLLCLPTRDVREPPAFKYGIVLDAGSSHTSMFVYKWPADKENDTGIVGQHSSCHVQGGGISSYADNPSGAGRSLVECLEQALRDVPRDRHASTPLYLGATAGMRLLNLRSPEAAAAVLAAVGQTLAQYPFDFRGARILSGQDEGVFGWVTANYLLENLIKYSWVGRWFRPRKGTLGAMDLGGASTQITFETSSPVEDPANEVHLRLYGQHYRVYTHSFLCYGQDQVLQRLLASALQGSSDPDLCRALVSQLFNVSTCGFSRCSFDGVFQPPLAGSFIAFSAFYRTVEFLRTKMGLPVATLQQLDAAVETTCKQTWEELQARAPGPLDRLANSCAAATFVQQLLSRGYGFDERTFGGLAFQRQAADTAVGWALGYMLNLTNLVPSDPPGLRKGLQRGAWSVALLLFGALLLAALALGLRQVRSAKAQRAI